MWYRLSRREDDFRIECSGDGASWQQMRICHLYEAAGAVRVGVYAASPEDSSFTARFSDNLARPLRMGGARRPGARRGLLRRASGERLRAGDMLPAVWRGWTVGLWGGW